MICVFFIYLIHFFGLNSFTKEVYSDAIIVLFVKQLIFQTHYVLKIVKEVSYALHIRIFCVKNEFPGDHDTSKLSSVTGLEKNDDESSPGRKIAAHRLNTDT